MTTYDDVPYPSLSHVQTHPDVLATLGRLTGLEPAPVTACRVLEIGCAGGGNLIPMVLGLPGSTFVGIDYAARQVAAGQTAIEALGLKNISLRPMNILDITPQFGQFDYIIAHGIYSWVPAEVRDRLLAVCKQNLAEMGLAFISYNTYPGWHMLGSIREMMLYHVREIKEPHERVAQARALLAFLAESVPTAEHVRSSLLAAYSRFLKRELERLGTHRSDAYIFHDELEETNEPVYFHQFMEQAERNGLQFVNEVDFRTALPQYYPPQVTEALFKTARTIVEMEQYLDFLRSRTFRQTVLCHAGLNLNGTLSPDSLEGFLIGVRAVPESDVIKLHSVTVEKFKGSDGATLAIDHPLSKAAMVCLAERWPQVVPFAAVAPMALERLNANGHAGTIVATPDDNFVMAANLLKAYVYSDQLVEVHSFAPDFTLDISERPVASPWARWQAKCGELEVTNLRHERLDLDPFNRHLLPYLDGTRDQAALVEFLLAGPVAGGTLVVQQDNQPVTDPVQVRRLVADEVQSNLRWLARAAFLVA